jgi:hypothetical protein
MLTLDTETSLIASGALRKSKQASTTLSTAVKATISSAKT